jgi:hypothetical protein
VQYSSALALSSRPDEGGWSSRTPDTLPPGKRAAVRCTGGCMDPRAGLEGCGKSCLHRDSIPVLSSPERVEIKQPLGNVGL